MLRAPAGSGRFVGDQQVFQLGDAVLELEPAAFEPFEFQLVLGVGRELVDGLVQRTVLGAQHRQALADQGKVGKADVHRCTVHHRRAGWLRRPGRAGTGDRGEPVEWAA